MFVFRHKSAPCLPSMSFNVYENFEPTTTTTSLHQCYNTTFVPIGKSFTNVVLVMF